MKLAMKFTFGLFAAFLVGLLGGGLWLRHTGVDEAREALRGRAIEVLDALAASLAPALAQAGTGEPQRLVELAVRMIPAPVRIEVLGADGHRLATAGLDLAPARPLEGLYHPVRSPQGATVGGIQLLLDVSGVGESAARSTRPGGTALFVAMCGAWILAEVMAALVVFSPLKKLHRALEAAVRGGGPVDPVRLREECRTRGGDEVAAIAENAATLVERARRPGEAGGTGSSPGRLTVLGSRGATNREV